MRSKCGYFLAGGLVAILAFATTRALDAKPGIKKGSQINLTPEDYLEIQQLINNYPRDVDPGSVRHPAWKFSKDARFTIANATHVPMIKPADFTHWFGTHVAPDGQAAKGGVRHFNTTPVIVDLPDGTARGSTYWFQMSVKEKGGKPTVDMMGTYEDIYVKTSEGWRIKDRLSQLDSFVGSYQKVVPSPVLTVPSTWKLPIGEVIAQQLASGLTRDENGAPSRK